MRETEKIYDIVYGKTFADYKTKDLREFIHPYEIRFQRNGLNAKEIFSGKRCLDAGCGNGRGAFFMLQNGAEFVEMIDVSENNLQSSQNFALELGFSNKINVQKSTLESIPFEDGEFDFVWCNGVIMHAEKPNQCLAEISRVCKTHGHAWIYIYGSGGLYWKVIYRFRKLLSDIDVIDAIKYLKYFRYSPRYVAEFIDDWYASNLRTYTHNDLSKSCESLGFETPQRLVFGMDYDTSQRLELAQSDLERNITGEGDLRYFLNKISHKKNNQFFLNEDEKGSYYSWPNSVKELEFKAFSLIPELEKVENWKKVAICARIQRELRILMDRNCPLKEDDFLQIFYDLVEINNLSL